MAKIEKVAGSEHSQIDDDGANQLAQLIALSLSALLEQTELPIHNLYERERYLDEAVERAKLVQELLLMFLDIDLYIERYGKDFVGNQRKIAKFWGSDFGTPKLDSSNNIQQLSVIQWRLALAGKVLEIATGRKFDEILDSEAVGNYTQFIKRANERAAQLFI